MIKSLFWGRSVKTTLWSIWGVYTAFVVCSPILPGPDALYGVVSGLTGYALTRYTFFK